jgi:hypothetical protein
MSNLLFISLILLPGLLEAENRFLLFSEQEAISLNMNLMEWKKIKFMKTRSISPPGPSIEFKNPRPINNNGDIFIETTQNTDLLIYFKNNISEVDMKSLEIDAYKGIFSLSLTDRLQQFVKKNSLEAKGIEIPEGNYVIAIHIADNKGNVTEQEYRLQVN